MLIFSARIKRFSPNFNSIHMALTFIDPRAQICKFFKIQDGGGRHLGFRKMSIVSARIKRFSPNLNSTHIASTFMDCREQICKFFTNPRWRRPPSWILKNVNSFCKDKAILTKFQRSTLGTNLYPSPGAKMLLFQNSRWRPPPSWIMKNVNNFRKDEAILTKFQQSAPGTNLYRFPGAKMQNFQNPRWRPPPSWILKRLLDSSGRDHTPPGF